MKNKKIFAEPELEILTFTLSTIQLLEGSPTNPVPGGDLYGDEGGNDMGL